MPFCSSSLGVLGAEWDEVSDFERAKEPERLPVVLTQAEVGAVLGEMSGPNGLVAHLLYGAGLRLAEALRLRVKDTGFEYEQITTGRARGRRIGGPCFPECLKIPFADSFRKASPSGGRTKRPDMGQPPCRKL